jgi:hypothetical protein
LGKYKNYVARAGGKKYVIAKDANEAVGYLAAADCNDFAFW